MDQRFTDVSRDLLAEPTGTPVLSVLGTLEGERRLVLWEDSHAALTPKCFKFLSKLAVVAVSDPGRWVRRDELERGENQARYLYRLRSELEHQCGELPTFWENNRRGGYRLTLQPHQIRINWDQLLNFDDWDLVNWVKEFEPEELSPTHVALDGSGQQAAA